MPPVRPTTIVLVLGWSLFRRPKITRTQHARRRVMSDVNRSRTDVWSRDAKCAHSSSSLSDDDSSSTWPMSAHLGLGIAFSKPPNVGHFLCIFLFSAFALSCSSSHAFSTVPLSLCSSLSLLLKFCPVSYFLSLLISECSLCLLFFSILQHPKDSNIKAS